LWRHSIFLTSLNIFDVIQYFWRHSIFLTSLNIFDVIQYFWRHSIFLTSLNIFDVIQYFWRHSIFLTLFSEFKMTTSHHSQDLATVVGHAVRHATKPTETGQSYVYLKNGASAVSYNCRDNHMGFIDLLVTYLARILLITCSLMWCYIRVINKNSRPCPKQTKPMCLTNFTGAFKKINRGKIVETIRFS